MGVVHIVQDVQGRIPHPDGAGIDSIAPAPVFHVEKAFFAQFLRARAAVDGLDRIAEQFPPVQHLVAEGFIVPKDLPLLARHHNRQREQGEGVPVCLVEVPRNPGEIPSDIRLHPAEPPDADPQHRQHHAGLHIENQRIEEKGGPRHDDEGRPQKDHSGREAPKRFLFHRHLSLSGRCVVKPPCRSTVIHP